MKRISLIAISILSAASEIFGQNPKISERPLPCSVVRADLPVFFGVRLDMPGASARKLFPKVRRTSVKSFPGYPLASDAGLVSVRSLFLPKADLSVIGISMESLEFANMETANISSLALQFNRMQKLTSEELFTRVTELTKIPPELWLLIDHGGGSHMSWRARCEDFYAQFDAQKGLYYRLWLTTINEFKTDEPTGPSNNDGE
jgi:hypothetical protein